MGSGEKVMHPGITIQVRGVTYNVVYEQVLAIATALDAIKKETVVLEANEVYILHNVSRSGDINPVGIETVSNRRRYLFTINATVTVTKSS